MTEYDHSAGLQFAPSQDHAHASMNNNDNNLHVDEAQEVYFGQGGQTYLQDLESNGNGDVRVTNDRDGGTTGSRRSSKYVFLPMWLKNSPTIVKVAAAGGAVLVVVFLAIMISGIAQLPSNNDDTTKFSSSSSGTVSTGNNNNDAGGGSATEDTGSGYVLPGNENTNPLPIPDQPPTSSPVTAAQVPVTPPPTASSSGSVPIFTSPEPTNEPTNDPTSEPTPNPTQLSITTEQPSPFPPITCPKDLQQVVNVDQSTVLRYDIVLTETGNNGIMCGRLEVSNHKGWVALAVSTDGKMIGSDAIIGEPSTKSVLKYNLDGKAANLVVPMETAKQTLTGTSIAEDKGTTIMTFTNRLIEPDQIPINPQGKNIFLHARGPDGFVGYHNSRTSFTLDFTKPVVPTVQPTEEPQVVVPVSSTVLPDSILQCTESAPCGQCLGACTSNADCAGELQCFVRSVGERVPGCFGQGKYSQNYCYDPFSDGATQLLTTNEKGCDKKDPCPKCFGNCDSNEACDKNLACFQRWEWRDPLEVIPGCAGQGVSATNYCFDPQDIQKN